MKNKPLSTGNDIVALGQTNTQRTLHKRFYSRILSAAEVSLFSSVAFQMRFESFIWLCWSLKESAFKCIKRHHYEAAFSPGKIVVASITTPLQQPKMDAKKQENISFRNEECFCCEVIYDGQKYYTRSFINRRFIFTVANTANSFENVFWGIQTIENNSYALQTKCVRSFVLEKLEQQLESKPLQIEKSVAGFPFIVQHNHIPVSFTHHGNFVGYSFVLENIA